jgi:hypothetical protein
VEENVVEVKEEKKEEVVAEENSYTFRDLEDMLGIPSDSILFSFGR